MKRLRQDEQGSVVVEMALLLPVILLLLAGVVEFGNAYWEQQVMTLAAREGARAASHLKTDGSYISSSNIRTLVRGYLTDGGVNSASATVTVTEELVPGSATAKMKVVTVTKPYSFSIFPHIFSYNLTLTGQAKMVKEVNIGV